MSSLSPSQAVRPSLIAVLAVVLMADVLDLVDGTLTSIAAPAIARDLGGGAGFISWLGTAYALALGVFLVLGGRLGDRFGQRRLFLIGMAGFTLSSLACGLSVNPAMLIAARFAQGAFGALLIPQGMAILTSTFSRAELGIAFSAFGPVLGLSAMAGPLIGGLIIDADIAGLGWRPMFLINIVSGLIVGFAFFATVNGLVFIISLFLQGTLDVSPSGAALRMLPMTLGIIVASAAGMALIPRLGRKLVVVGLGVTLLGAVLLALVIGVDGGRTVSFLAGALVVLGLGMGSCFGTIYDIALGDISAEEAGSASGSLSAAQQLAASTGMAVMSSAYLGEVSRLTGNGALLLCLAIAGAAILLSLPLTLLMPKAAPAELAH